MAELKQNTNVQTADFMQIQDLFYICLARWKWFVVSLLVTLSIAAVYILRTPPEYTRIASILIKDDSNGNSVSSELSNFADMGLVQSNTNVNNELIALQSPALMYEVISRLNLDMNYYLPGRFHKRVAYGKELPIIVSFSKLDDNESVRFSMDISQSGKVSISDFTYYLNGDKIEEDNEITGTLSDSISTPIGKIVVTPTPYYLADTEYEIDVVRSGYYATANKYSTNLSISLSDEDASVISMEIKDMSIQRAEDILNTIINVYNENWIKDKNQIAISTSMFINDRLAVIESELGNVDEDISSYKSENLLPDVQVASNMYMTQSSMKNDQILALNNQLYMTRYVRNYLNNEANNDKLLPANSGIDNVNIETLISDYNSKLLQRNSLVANSSTSNPLVVDLDKALDNMRQAIIVSVDNQIVALNNEIKSQQKDVRQTTARIAANPTQAKYLLSVERQQKVKESLYLFLLQKREENELSQAFTAYNTRIITPPYGSMLPTAPVRRNILIVAFVLGLFIPVVIIYIKENMNTKIRGRKDIEKLTIPFIGEIPLQMRNKKGVLPQKQTLKNAIVVEEGNRDVINEAFRVLRTNFEFMTEKESNVIIVTSFNPGSGKSFISMNIAVSLAIKNKRVLVIDGDMRHASTSAYVNSPAKGLSDYLSGREENLDKIIIKNKNYEKLHVLPVGTIPPNPTELLFNDRMKQIIDTLRGEYDYIFIDCPPIEVVADPQILEKLADRTIFVIRAGLFERNMLGELENIYVERRYKNMSLILNGTQCIGNQFGYKYGYGYRYGSDEKCD